MSVRLNLARILVKQAPPSPDPLVVEYAATEGVLALLEHCFRGTNAEAGNGHADLRLRARRSAVEGMLRQTEIRRIGGALELAGLSALLLKGNALAMWLYPEAHLRDSGDIDLCVSSHEDLLRTVELLSRLGYEFTGGQRSTHYEVTGRLRRSSVVVAEVDVHSRLVNSPLFAQRLVFPELWEAGIALPGNPAVRYLCPAHSLLHAAMHRAVDLSNGSPDRLKWVYDFHLFASHLSPQQWDQAVTLAQERELCGVLLRNLRDAAGLFGSTFPAGLLEALAAGAARESLNPERLGDWWYVQRRNLAAIPGVAGKLRWLAHRALPTQAQMRALYGQEHSWLRLVGLRIRRGVARLMDR